MKNKIIIAAAVAAYITFCILFSTTFLWWEAFSSREVLISVCMLFVILFGIAVCGIVIVHFLKTNRRNRTEIEYVLPRHHIVNRNARCKGYIRLNNRGGV